MDTMSHELYTLTLSHEWVCPDGSKVQMSPPIKVSYVQLKENGVPQSVLVNEMLHKLEDYVLREAGKENGLTGGQNEG